MNRLRWWTAAAGLVAFALGFVAARQVSPEEVPRHEPSSRAARPADAEAPRARAAATRSRQVGAGVATQPGGVLRGEDMVAFFDQLGGPDHPDCDERCNARTQSAMDDALRKLHDELYAAKGPASRCAPDGLIDDTIINVRFRMSFSPTELRMGEGRSIDEDLPAEVRACLDDYLRHTVTIRAEEVGGPLATAEFDALDIFPTGDLRTPK